MSHRVLPPPAELVDEAPEALTAGDGVAPAPQRARRGVFAAVVSAAVWCFGLASLVLGLAVLAAIPLGQFLALGYLLESSGRVARTGRLRDGFIGIRTAAGFGRVALVGFVMWLPLYLLSLQAEAARVIDPDGRAVRLAEGWLAVLAVLFSLHAVGAM